jgi:hypothetical protein
MPTRLPAASVRELAAALAPERPERAARFQQDYQKPRSSG